MIYSKMDYRETKSKHSNNGLRVELIFSKKFEKNLKKVKTTKTLLKKNIKRILEGLFRRGETLLPKKDLGGSLIFFKGRIEEKEIAERFLATIYINNLSVIPVFIADKKSKLGKNIRSDENKYYDIAKDVLLSIKNETYTVEPLRLSTEKINLPGGMEIP